MGRDGVGAKEGEGAGFRCKTGGGGSGCGLRKPCIMGEYSKGEEEIPECEVDGMERGGARDGVLDCPGGGMRGPEGACDCIPDLVSNIRFGLLDKRTIL